MSGKNVFKWVGVIFGIVGLGLLVGAALAVMSSNRFLSESVRTTGNVVDFIESYDDEGTLMYTPVFEYIDQQGATYTARANYSSSNKSYMKGEAVELLYLPSDPEDVRTPSWFSLWGLALILGAMGIFFVGFAALFLWVISRPGEIDVKFGAMDDTDIGEL